MRKKIGQFKSDFSFIWQFAIDDIKSKYSGSALGIAWAFLQPIITIVLYWFVFQLGFRSQPVDNFPFILWLLAGLVPWFFISDAISGATASLVEYNYLVKKVLFNINILPVAKVVSTLLVQLVLIAFTALLYALWGYFPDRYYFLLPIYLFYMVLLASGIVYFTATLYVFFKDVMQIVSIVLQMVFWLTPFVWDFSVMPEIIQKIMKFNPVYYIVVGFRNIFVYKDGILGTPLMTLYYWGITFLIFILGTGVFRRCKKHFADVI